MINKIKYIAERLSDIGIQAYYVGGWVRDRILGIESDDIDIVLVGCHSDLQRMCLVGLLKAVSTSLTNDPVGKQFPVWIADIDGIKIDFALARRERKGPNASRKDFDVITEGVTLEEDLGRRDLTINAMAIDCITMELYDPFSGLSDLKLRYANPVSNAFMEDPLRPIRAARFIATYGLEASDKLIDMCRMMTPDGLAPERVGQELWKAMCKAGQPSKFFQFLLSIDWLHYHFSPLYLLINCRQSPDYHPEGDAFVHTLLTMDEANSPLIRIAMLCHDFGKAKTTEIINGKITSHGHDAAGVQPARDMMEGISLRDRAFQDKIAMLVRLHMVRRHGATRKSVAKLNRKLQSVGLGFEDLVEVCRCDVSGRPPLRKYTPDIGQEFLGEVLDETVEPIVNGRMLIDMGWKQGPELGAKLKEFMNLQDAGELTIDNWKEAL